MNIVQHSFVLPVSPVRNVSHAKHTSERFWASKSFVLLWEICLDEFHFRWLKIKRIKAAFPISITLISNHLKWNSSELLIAWWLEFIKFFKLLKNVPRWPHFHRRLESYELKYRGWKDPKNTTMSKTQYIFLFS